MNDTSAKRIGLVAGMKANLTMADTSVKSARMAEDVVRRKIRDAEEWVCSLRQIIDSNPDAEDYDIDQCQSVLTAAEELLGELAQEKFNGVVRLAYGCAAQQEARTMLKALMREDGKKQECKTTVVSDK